jgi:hypothetical protein
MAAEQPTGPWERVWFAGLNAFTTAQRMVIDQMHRSGLARFAWDADTFYLDDPDEGAGLHVRAAIRRFGSGAVPPTSVLAAKRSQVTIATTASPIEQAWAAASELRKIPAPERDGAAIVLADASLLEPLLEALAEEDGPVNVTMGRSVASLPAGSLFTSFFAMLAGARDHSGYLRSDVERVLLHPFLHGEHTEEHVRALTAGGHMRLTMQQAGALVARSGDDARACFDPNKSVQQRTLALIAWAQERMRRDRAGNEQLYQASIAVQRVLRGLERYGHQPKPELFSVIMERALRRRRSAISANR